MKIEIFPDMIFSDVNVGVGCAGYFNLKKDYA